MAGRPPRTFTAAEIRKVEIWAKAQAKDSTMARALGVDLKTFRAHFSATTKQKRVEGKLAVLEAQFRCATNRAASHSTDRIWWGKQFLDQTDRQKSEVLGDIKIDAPVIQLTLVPRKEAGDAPPAESACDADASAE